MVTLELLNSFCGETTIHIEDVELEKRAELAKTVEELLKQGHAIFLIQGEDSRRVKGFDPETNDWLVLARVHMPPPHKLPPDYVEAEAAGVTQDAGVSREATKRRRGRPPKNMTERVPAAGTTATAVGATAGG